jgi:hypothetical protein
MPREGNYQNKEGNPLKWIPFCQFLADENASVAIILLNICRM